jgi:hypothetical protein
MGEGCWTIETSVDGYEKETKKVLNYKGLKSSRDTDRLFLTPSGKTLATGEVRVILSWGSQPRDLDLYCRSSKGQVVFYGNKSAGEMKLDVDVQNGFGPETITLTLVHGVSYYFYVHHFSGEQSFQTSNAVLRVQGIPGISEISVPSGFEADVAYGDKCGIWQVLKIDGQRVASIANKVVKWDSDRQNVTW